MYAALWLERSVQLAPYGVVFNFHKLQTDKGLAEVLYASRGEYAVNKQDVCNNWLAWWEKHKSDYAVKEVR